MERYQIRIHGKPLDEVYREIAWRSARAAAPQGADANVDVDERAARALADSLAPHLHRYDNCGTEIFCDECALFQPLMTGKGASDAFDENLREDADRYHLFAPTDLPALLEDVATAVLAVVAPGQSAGPSAVETRRKVLRTIRDGLAPYVYFNSECGHTRTCEAAQELPVEIERH